MSIFDAPNLTTRQLMALHLYFDRGLSYRKIGKALGIAGPTAFELVQRGKNAIITYRIEVGEPNTTPVTGTVCSSSSRSSPTADLRNAASRQDELLDELEARMEQRASELDAIESCMSGDSCLLTHIKRNQYDRWEMDVLARTGRTCLNTGDYECRKLTRYALAVQAEARMSYMQAIELLGT